MGTNGNEKAPSIEVSLSFGYMREFWKESNTMALVLDSSPSHTRTRVVFWYISSSEKRGCSSHERLPG